MRASEIQPKKLVIFDIDDTLVNTQTKIHVIKDGKVVKSLNSHDFTHYKLQPGESFDFEDFKNAREFFDNHKPIIPMMNQLKRDITTGNKVVMVTARSDFDDKELFLDTFRKYGVDTDKVHVYRAGNIKGGSTEERKKSIIKTLLDKDDYTKAIMYDDAKPNLHTFIELKKDHPRTRFYAWHVNPDGEANEYMRENFVSERKRKKSRWAAYGPGPYGGYGYAIGYSGDGGSAGTESIQNSNIDIVDVIKNFLPLAINYLELKSLPKITFSKDVESKHEQPTFGVYHHDSDTKLIELDIENRHPMDIVRTLAHELVHYRQDLDHKLKHDSWKTGSPTENQAHEKAGIMMRKFDKMYPKYMKLSAVNLKENFADGKKPGRKGLAKRSGVNCKASVSSLRKTAKNSSGEKARMAHWCANMKSGRLKNR